MGWSCVGEVPVTIARICCGVLAKQMLLLSASRMVVEEKVGAVPWSATIWVLSMP